MLFQGTIQVTLIPHQKDIKPFKAVYLSVYQTSTAYINICIYIQDFPGDSDGKASAYNAGDLGSIPGQGRSSGEGNGNPLQYSCLENPMDGGAWQATTSPWGCKELDMTERIHSLTHSLIPSLLNLLPTPHPPKLGHHRAPS